MTVPWILNTLRDDLRAYSVAVADDGMLAVLMITTKKQLKAWSKKRLLMPCRPRNFDELQSMFLWSYDFFLMKESSQHKGTHKRSHYKLNLTNCSR